MRGGGAGVLGWAAGVERGGVTGLSIGVKNRVGERGVRVAVLCRGSVWRQRG
jgi:hypothetical protein